MDALESNLGYYLAQGYSAYRLEQPEIKPRTFQLVDNLLSCSELQYASLVNFFFPLHKRFDYK